MAGVLATDSAKLYRAAGREENGLNRVVGDTLVEGGTHTPHGDGNSPGRSTTLGRENHAGETSIDKI